MVATQMPPEAPAQPATHIGAMEKLGLQFAMALVSKGFQALAAKYPNNRKVQDACNNGMRLVASMMLELAGM